MFHTVALQPCHVRTRHVRDPRFDLAYFPRDIE